MSQLQIQLLGAFQVFLAGEEITGFESNKVRALLAYLAMESGSPHSRDTLAGLFWPEQPDQTARKNLRQALSNLRKVIQDAAADPPYLRITRGTIQLEPSSAHYVDAAEFASLLEACDEHRHRRLETCSLCARCLQQAVDLYRGDFLSGFFLDDSVAYQDWMLLNRERFHRQTVGALAVLTQYYENRADYAAARRCANRQVALDPWREEAHRQLMRLLALNGERSAALKQYETCRTVLAEELGVEPAPETAALYEKIKTGGLKPPVKPVHLSNLPAELTPFVGREREMRTLTEYLRDPDCRLLTLTGPGGVGKTRLALQAAAEEGYNFQHGVYSIALGAVAAPKSLPYTIAEALNFRFQGTADPAAQLVNFLRDKELLLVLDNFEHLLDGVDLIVAVLRGAPRVVLLVTSREALGLQAERILDLAGLPYPRESNQRNAQTYAAVRLFVTRARRRQPDIASDEDNIPHIVRISQLAEGLPLAIELAAAWVHLLTCKQIADEMQRGLDVLAASMRDLPERHRSLRATFEHSWNLLTPQEQRIFKQLAVFRGGFEAEAAKQVAGAGLSALVALVEKSLLRREASGRYSMHELLRQFAAEKLAASPEEQIKARERFSAYFSEFLHRKKALLKSSRQPQTLDQIGREIENIQDGWRWSLESGEFSQIEQSLEALYLFFDGRSRYREGVDWFAQIVDGLGKRHPASAVYWKARIRLGALSYRVGEYQRADALLRESLDALRSLGLRADEAFALNSLGNLAYLRGEFVEAERFHQESLAIRRELGDPYEISISLNGLGLTAYMQGQYARARQFFNESLDIHKAINDPWSMAVRYNNLGMVAHALGEYAEARSLYRQSLDFWQQVGSQSHGIASCYNNLGLVAEALGEYEQAQERYQDALKIFQNIGHRYGVAGCLNNLGNIAAAQAEYDRAQRLYRQGLRIREELGDQRGVASASHNLGQIALRRGALQEARAYFLRALGVAWEGNIIPLVLECLGSFAQLLMKDGQAEKAVELLAHVLQHPASDQGGKDTAAELLAELRSDISEERYTTALAAGHACQLEDLVGELLSKG